MLVRRMAITIVVLALLRPFAAAAKMTDKPSLPMKELVSALHRSQEAVTAGLGTASCAYRAELGGKPVIAGKLTVDFSSLRTMGSPRDWPYDPLFGPLTRIDIQDWPAYAQGMPPGEPKPGRIVGVSFDKVWLISADGKVKEPYKWGDFANLLVFAGWPPALRREYLAAVDKYMLPDASDGRSLLHRTGGDKIDRRTCIIYSFFGSQGKGQPDPERPDTYKVWLDSEMQLPLREEMWSHGQMVQRQTLSDFVRLSSGAFAPRRCIWILGSDMTVETDYERFGPNCLLPREFRAKARDFPAQKVTFSNWKKVVVSQSFFSPPAGAKEVH